MSEILITGASIGIGRVLAELLASRGHRVIGSMRDVGGRNAQHARTLRASGIDVVEIDVTDDASVARGVPEAGRVDVLVNNAGYGLLGPLEAATVEDLRAQFETNVFGVQRLIRAVLPQMRERADGLLVHISSGAGRFAVPASGAYCASKWALEAIGETLRYELGPLGIDSVIVEPGRYTSHFDESAREPSDTDRSAVYAFLREARRKRLASMEDGDPAELAKAIMQLIECPRGSRPTRISVRPEGPGLLDELNALQSRLARNVLDAFGDERLLENGV